MVDGSRTLTVRSETLDLLFEHNPNPMWIYDLATLSFLAVNSTAVRIYGYSREQFLTMTIRDIRPPEDVPRLLASVEGSRDAYDRSSGWQHQLADGRIIEVDISSHRLLYEGHDAVLVVVNDTTERNRALQRVRLTENLYRELLEQASDGIVVFDGDGRIELANRHFCELVGYRSDELVGVAIPDLLDPADGPSVTRNLERLRNGQTLRFERLVHGRDGVKVPVEIGARMVSGHRFQAIVRDVRERKRSEEEIATRERRFRALLQNSSDIITVVDGYGRPSYVSPSITRSLGWTPEERIGIDLFRDMHPDDLPRVMADFRALLAGGGNRTATFRYRTAAGDWVWLEAVGSNRLDDPDVGGVVLNIRDISARVEAQAALRTSEAYYRAIIEKIAEGIVLIEADRRVRLLSDSALAILGYVADDFLGRERSDLIHPADREAFERALAKLQTRPGASASIEYRFRHRDGRWVWLEGTVTNLLEDPDVAAFVLNYRDVSERKYATEKIRALNRELRTRLEHLDALRHIDMAITGSLGLEEVLEVFLTETCATLEIEAAAVRLFEPERRELLRVIGIGLPPDGWLNERVRLGEDLPGRAAALRQVMREIHLGPGDEPGATCWHVPLVAKGQLQGVLELYRRGTDLPDAKWHDFMEALADQGAIAIENAQLVRNLQRSNAELQLAYERTISGWARALDLKDEGTAGHSQRVTDLAVRLGRRLGVPEAELTHLRRGALLHDIGKMGVPDEILRKPGRLDEGEWEVMKRHPDYAFEMLSPITFLRPALDIPRAHHERWDGKGYPYALSGEEIPFAARIFAVVDAYDALTSDRPYRSAWPSERVTSYLAEHAGQRFDPRVVRTFLEMLDEDDDPAL